jgi:DNA polymerase kappa
VDDSTSKKRQKLDSDSSNDQDYTASTCKDELPAFFLDGEDEDIEDNANEDYHRNRDSASPAPTALIGVTPKKPTASDCTNHERKSKIVNETQVCPICGRVLDADNQGLNEHVDFCLSKQAIKEAQTTAAIRDRRSLTKR